MNHACCADHASPPPARRLACPRNGHVGRAVARLTLGALLRSEARRQLQPEAQYWFCPAPDCDVVYYTDDGTFAERDLNVPVWQKRPAPDTPICYCFGWTLAHIRVAPDKQAVLNQIAAEVKAGNCYCEVTNPQGACCLANVRDAIVRP